MSMTIDLICAFKLKIMQMASSNCLHCWFYFNELDLRIYSILVPLISRKESILINFKIDVIPEKAEEGNSFVYRCLPN